MPPKKKRAATKQAAKRRRGTPKQTVKARRARQDSSRGPRPLLHYLVRELVANNPILDRWSRRRDTGHRMRHWSPDIGGIYEELIGPVRAARVIIDPPLDRDTRAEREAGRQLEIDCRRGDGIVDVLGHLAEGPWDGRILLELTGEFGLGNPDAGEIPIPGVWRVPDEAITYDRDGGVGILQDDGSTLWIDGEADRWRYLYASWGYPVAGDPRGLALKERVYWSWHLLTFGKKFWLTALERFGMPTLFVKVMDSEWESQRDAWLEIINDFVSQAGVVYPGATGDQVEMKNEGPRSFPAYKEFTEEFRKAIRFALLGESLTEGQAKQAPATAARVHAGNVTDKQWQLVAWCEQVLNRTLIPSLSESRFGAYRGHRLRLDLGDPRDIAQRLQQHDRAVQAGLTVYKSELYDTVGYRQPTEEAHAEDVVDLTQAPGAGTMGGALGGGLGFPAITPFAEATPVDGAKLIDGRTERQRLHQAAHLADVAAVEGAAALASLAQTLRDRARPFVGRAGSPDSGSTPGT